MKISELIVELDVLQEKHGDIEVSIRNEAGEDHDITITEENFKDCVPETFWDKNGNCWGVILNLSPIDQ